MRFRIHGENRQTLMLEFGSGESAFVEAGTEVLYQSESLERRWRLPGGLVEAVTRRLTGEGFFTTAFVCGGERGELALSFALPGKIVPMPLGGKTVLCSRGAYLCSYGDVSIGVGWPRGGMGGIFGHERGLLKRITGDGMVFLHAGSNLLVFDRHRQRLPADASLVGVDRRTVALP